MQSVYHDFSVVLTLEIRHRIGHDVVEDVVAPLQRLLEGDPRLLQEVDLHVSAAQLAGLVEVDADELALEDKTDLSFIVFQLHLFADKSFFST